jgi:hypothetical protein
MATPSRDADFDRGRPEEGASDVPLNQKRRRVRRQDTKEDAMDGSRNGLRPAIARIWRGRTTAAKAEEYTRYQYEHGIKPLAEKALGVHMLREDRASESKFVTISYWESVEAMARFAGDDPRRIHHLERDAEFLLELPSTVQVLDILASIGRTGGDRS